MKRATVRDLRNRYTQLLAWLAAGEEIVITQRGKPIARLCPEPAERGEEVVDWSQSPAVLRDRSQERVMTAEESEQIRHEAAFGDLYAGGRVSKLPAGGGGAADGVCGIPDFRRQAENARRGGGPGGAVRCDLAENGAGGFRHEDTKA